MSKTTITIERAGRRWAFAVKYDDRVIHSGKAASRARAEAAAAKTAAQCEPGYYALAGAVK